MLLCEHSLGFALRFVDFAALDLPAVKHWVPICHEGAKLGVNSLSDYQTC
jgi:hypothetical protein